MLVHRTKKLLVRSTCVGSDLSCFHEQTDYTLIRQLLQELPDLGVHCLRISLKQRVNAVVYFHCERRIHCENKTIVDSVQQASSEAS